MADEFEDPWAMERAVKTAVSFQTGVAMLRGPGPDDLPAPEWPVVYNELMETLRQEQVRIADAVWGELSWVTGASRRWPAAIDHHVGRIRHLRRMLSGVEVELKNLRFQVDRVEAERNIAGPVDLTDDGRFPKERRTTINGVQWDVDPRMWGWVASPHYDFEPGTQVYFNSQSPTLDSLRHMIGSIQDYLRTGLSETVPALVTELIPDVH